MPEVALPLAADLMTEPRCVLRPDFDIFDAIDRLIEFGVPAAPVTDAQGQLLGILTEKDCLRVLSAEAYDSHPGTATVAFYQSPIPWVCAPDMDLFRASELFLQNNFPVLPVATRGKLVGVLSRAALLRGIQKVHRLNVELGGSYQTTPSRPSSIEMLQRVAARSTPAQLAEMMRR